MKAVRVIGIAVVVALGGFGATSAAVASPAWQDPPTNVSVPVADTWSDAVELVAGPDGTLMAMWREQGSDRDTSMLISRLWTGQAWAATPVSVAGPSSSIGDYSLVSRPDGSFVAIWAENDELIWSSIHTAGAWSAPVALTTSPADRDLERVVAVAAANGVVLAAWERDEDIDIAVLRAGGWDATQSLGRGASPSVAAAPDNTLAVTWGSNAGANMNRPAARTYSAGVWSETAFLSDDRQFFAPVLAPSPTGFVTMWMEGSSRLPWARTFSGAGWSSKFALRESNEIGGGVTAPINAVPTPSGTVVTWSDGEFNSAIIWARTFTGTTWLEPVKLLDASQVGLEHLVAGRPDGSYVILWQRNGGGPLMARTLTGTELGEPVELSAAENNPVIWLSQLATASNGYVVATWPQSGVISAAVFDGERWSSPTEQFDRGSRPRAAATSDNLFFVAWEAEEERAGLVRATTLATPATDTVGPGDPGSPGGDGASPGGDPASPGGHTGVADPSVPELARTGADANLSVSALVSALLLLVGASLIVIVRGRRQLS